MGPAVAFQPTHPSGATGAAAGQEFEGLKHKQLGQRIGQPCPAPDNIYKSEAAPLPAPETQDAPHLR